MTENNFILMSRSLIIDARRPRQSLLGRFSNSHLPSPAVTLVLLIAWVFLLRLPSVLLSRELYIDESGTLSNAMTFMVDPRPWIAVDPYTLGPLNPYLVTVFLWLGFRPSYVLLHMLASVLVCLQILIAYLTLRRFRSAETAAAGALLMVLFYGFATKQDYLHYAGEWLPTLLCATGFYFYVAWLDEAPDETVRPLCLLFASGLFLGSAPWGKLQAAPITGGVGLLIMLAVLRAKSQSRAPSWQQAREITAFCTGGIVTTCIMLAILAKTGALGDFWKSYIQGNLIYAGRASWSRSFVNVFLVFLVSPLHQLLFVGLSLLFCTSAHDPTPPFLAKQKWALYGSFVYFGAALLAICRVRYLFPHHAILLVPPLTYLVVLLAPIPTLKQICRSPKFTLAVCVIMVGLTTVLYAAYVVNYAQMIRAIRSLSHDRPVSTVTLAKRIPDVAKPEADTAIGRFIDISIGRRHWALPDVNERVSAVVRDIEKKRSVRSLSIWGWAPGVYVLTGMPPATRDAVVPDQIRHGPMQMYYVARYVGDLRGQRPDLFIDAVTPDACIFFGWTENDGYESVPAVRKFIDDNYVKVDELTLVEGAKPVRFFARRTP